MSWLLTLSPYASPVVVGSSAVMGMWFTVRLVIHFQRDFTNRYAGELERERERRRGIEDDMDAMADARREKDHDLGNAYNYIDKLTKFIRASGLEVPPDD